jgi:hypothetical protein
MTLTLPRCVLAAGLTTNGAEGKASIRDCCEWRSRLAAAMTLIVHHELTQGRQLPSSVAAADNEISLIKALSLQLLCAIACVCSMP